MGVHNTSFERVTLYIKKEHISFFEDIRSAFGESGETIPSRSDLIRALLDKYSGLEDWQSKTLYQRIDENRKKITQSATEKMYNG